MIFDIAGLQNPDYVGRGIGRYIQAVIDAALASGLSVDAFAFDPSRLPPALLNGAADRVPLVPYGPKLLAMCRGKTSRYLLASPFEPSPHWAVAHFGKFARRRSGSLSVLVYDLIPQLFPERYLNTVESQSQYRNGLEAIWAADQLCAISRNTARDVENIFGFVQESVVVVGTGVDSFFHAADDVTERAIDIEIVQRLRGSRSAVRYIMAVTGSHFTKNLDALIVAYRNLPASVRREVALLLVGKVTQGQIDGLQNDRLKDTAGRGHNLGRSVQVLSDLSDLELRALYRHASLFVMPSIYEGFGLPAAEAVSCGAVTLVSSTSSLPEVVPFKDAQFNPMDPIELTNKMALLLSDSKQHGRLQVQMPTLPRQRWVDVASKIWCAVEADQALPALRPTLMARHVSRPSLALVGPLPPNGGGIGGYNHSIIPSMMSEFDVTFFATTSTWLAQTILDDACDVLPISALPDLAGNFDRIIYTFGNSEHHLATFDMLRRIPGFVWLHDVRLGGFFFSRSAKLNPKQPWDALADYAATWYEPEIASDIRRRQSMDHLKATRTTFARELSRAALGIILHSSHAQRLLDADMGIHAQGISLLVVPLAIPGLTRHTGGEGQRRNRTELVVGTIGYQEAIRMTDSVLDAALVIAEQRPVHFKVLGSCSAGYEHDLRQRISKRSRLRITFSGFLPGDAHRFEICSLDVAVQLRRMSNGESSATIADCLRLGIPVVTNMESAHEFWGDALTMAVLGESAVELSRRIVQAVDGPDCQARLNAASSLASRLGPAYVASTISRWLASRP